MDNLIYDTLVGTDPKTLDLVPRLATKWESVNDTTWRLTLRTGVKFTDGTDFNADAVKFNLDRAQQAARAKSYAAPIKSVSVVDPSTVELLTDGPNAATMRNLSVPILSMVSPKAAQSSADALVNKPVGTGPFMLKDWTPKQQIVLVRNTDYWGSKPPLDQITFLPIPDDATRLSAYQAGNVDVIISPPLETVKSLKSDGKSDVTLAPASRTVWFGFNVGDDTLKNEKLRAALAMAIDRKLLVSTVAESLVRPAVGLIPPEVVKPNFDLPDTFDLAAAKKMLSDSGAPSGLKLKFWTPQGRYPKDKEIAEAIQQELADLGVTADLSVIEWGAYLDSLARHEQQLYLIGWGFTSGDADAGMRQIAYSSSTFDYTNIQDPAVDKAIDQAVQELRSYQAKRYVQRTAAKSSEGGRFCSDLPQRDHRGHEQEGTRLHCQPARVVRLEGYVFELVCDAGCRHA